METEELEHKSRQAFEKYAKYLGFPITKNNTGIYVNIIVGAMWSSWKESQKIATRQFAETIVADSLVQYLAEQQQEHNMNRNDILAKRGYGASFEPLPWDKMKQHILHYFVKIRKLNERI
jgi:hypothetical protein